MEAKNYKSFWDEKATTTTGALIAVDGSANEEVARLTGAYTARQVECALALTPQDRVLELVAASGALDANSRRRWRIGKARTFPRTCWVSRVNGLPACPMSALPN